MIRRVKGWVALVVAAIFHFNVGIEKPHLPRLPQGEHDPQLQRREDESDSPDVILDEGPHSHEPWPPPPPPEVPFIENQSMLEVANQVVFARYRALRAAAVYYRS